MSWINMLLQTYENNSKSAGVADQRGIALSIIAHMTANAQLELTIDNDGNLMNNMCILDKNSGKTLIPVTEASAGRANAIAPHALSDTLSYVAGDFCNYVDEKTAIKCRSKFDAYINALKDWSESEYTNEKVIAIYKYLSKGELAKNLIANGILKCDETGRFVNEKISSTEYEKVLVRFRVLIPDDTQPDAVWEDKDVVDNYVRYYLHNQGGSKSICYITGEEQTISNNHPKGIVSANYGAKLISANDKVNYTFRGRFSSIDEACTVGYLSSQKIHSALTWLMARQGVHIGQKDKRTYVCWNPYNKDIPIVEDNFEDEIDYDYEEDVVTHDCYKRYLKDVLNGYKNNLNELDDVVYMGVDAATTGRLSIVYYSELKAWDYLNRLEDWYSGCCWWCKKYGDDKKPYMAISTPLTKLIPIFAFGTEHGERIELNDKVLKEQSQRILHCIVDGERIPRDIVQALVNRASTPSAYSKKNWEKVLFAACAVLRKYYLDRKEGVSMTLKYEEENGNDRSYLFGRLLAVLEQIESYAMWSKRRNTDKKDDRETNAIRLLPAYVNHPVSTWEVLKVQINPYLIQLQRNKKKYYENLITEITLKLAECGSAELERPLEGKYLFGYYLQRNEFITKSNNASNNNDKDTENKED